VPSREFDLNLWKVDLQQSADWIDAASAAVLSADERSHWETAHGHVRRRYLVARIALRLARADAVDRPPVSLRLLRNGSGKPLLAGDAAGEPVHFNLARAGDCCVIAVTRAGPVGVDVEHVVALAEVADIVQSRFAVEEAQEIMSLRGEARLRAFFNCWTRKEAYLKARGVGLLAPLEGVVVTVSDDAPAFLSLHDDDPDCWSLFTVPLECHAVGAVALRSAGRPSRTVLEPETLSLNLLGREW